MTEVQVIHPRISTSPMTNKCDRKKKCSMHILSCMWYVEFTQVVCNLVSDLSCNKINTNVYTIRHFLTTFHPSSPEHCSPRENLNLSAFGLQWIFQSWQPCSLSWNKVLLGQVRKIKRTNDDMKNLQSSCVCMCFSLCMLVFSLGVLKIDLYCTQSA